MRIRRLQMTDFRCFADAELTFGPGTYIGGPNGAGKSTILDAISVALTGTCRGSETGRGLQDLRRTGAKRKKWEIRLDVVDRSGEVVTLVRKQGEGPRSKAQALADRVLGLPAHQVRAALYSGELLDADDKRVQKLVLELASPGIEIPDEVRERYRRATGEEIPRGPVSLAELDRYHAIVYEARRDAKRDLAALGTGEAPVPEDLPEALRGEPVARLEEEARRIERKIRTFEKARDGARREADRLEQAVRDLEAEVQEARAALSGAPAEEDPAQRLDAQRERVASCREHAREAAAARGKEESSVAHAREVLRDVQRAIERVRGLSGVCPTCRRKITESSRGELLAALEKREREVREMLRVAEGALDQAVEASREAEEKLAAEERRLAGLEEAARRHRARESAAAELSSLEARLDAARKAAEEAQDLRDQAAALDGRVQQGRQLLAALQRYIGAVQGREAVEQRRKALLDRVDLLEGLVSALGPDGLRAEAAAGVDLFTRTVRSVAADLGFDIDLGPAARREGPILVNGRPARLLSSSERLRVGLALQVAVARVTGFGLVVVDDLDRCVGRSLAAVQRILRGLSADLQVVVLSAVRDEERFLRQADALAARTGWTVLHVSGGEVRLLAARKEAA